MTVKSQPTTVVTVGPAVIAVAYTMHKPAAAVVGVPQATYAPGAKQFADKSDHYAAISAWVESESERVSNYVGKLAAIKAEGQRIVIVVSASAVKHDPKGSVYSKLAAVDDLMTGLAILADERIDVA